MRIKIRQQRRIAWGLFLVLMPFFVVKTLHHHRACVGASCSSHHTDDQPASTDCPICHFFLSPFVQTEPLRLETVVTYFTCLSIRFPEPVYSVVHLSHDLRAPPAVFFL